MKSNKTNQNVSLKEVREIFSEIIGSKNNRKGVLIFDYETKKRYKNWHMTTNLGLVNSDLRSVFELLPKQLPHLPNHFEKLIAIAGVACPIVLSVIFYLIQASVFFATLVAVSTTPLCFLIFYISNEMILEKQSKLTQHLSEIIDLLKSK